jgi:putative ABC transport system substrate-binding protein
MVQKQVGALLINTDAFLRSQKEQLIRLAERYKMPTIYSDKEFTSAGGLISYGALRTDSYRQLGIYVGKILKGERPDELPVMQPAKFELVINLKTARALGLTVPPTLLARADEVIE